MTLWEISFRTQYDYPFIRMSQRYPGLPFSMWCLFKELNNRGPTELIRKRELTLSVLPSSVWVNSLFAELTGKQVDAVLKAHRYGYYTSPRQITTESIAKGSGLSRSTYEEHLRKAENRIMGSLIPYMQLFASGEKKPEKLMDKGSALDTAESAAQA